MKTVTIKGNEYTLGDLPFTEENVRLLERVSALLAMDESVNMGDLIKSGTLTDFRNALKESLTSGNGPEKAEQALADLSLTFRSDSDLMNVTAALIETMAGVE